MHSRIHPNTFQTPRKVPTKANAGRPEQAQRGVAGPTGPAVAGEPNGIGMPTKFAWSNPADEAVEQQLRQRLNSFDTALKAAAGLREPLGELLAVAGRISREQLTEALHEQQRSQEHLGDVLVRFGWISVAERDAALAFQRNQDGDEGPLRLGNLLVATGIITQEQLNDAIERQKQSGKRLGNVLVEAGYADPEQVQRGLGLQRRLVKSALMSLFTLCTSVVMSLPPGEANAASAMGTGENGRTQASASLDFQVKIPSVLRVKFLTQPSSLTIDETDVARGYVDIRPEKRMEIFTNNRDGFLVTLRGRFDVVRKVLIHGLSNVVEIDAVDAGATVQHRSRMADSSLALGYRFFLSPAAKPGTYPWPMAISAGTQY